MAQEKCPVCQNPYGCGCKKRTASDGKVVCASCLNAYELNIRK